MSVCVYVLFVLVEKFQELPSLIGKTRISLSELSVDIYESSRTCNILFVGKSFRRLDIRISSVAALVTCC